MSLLLTIAIAIVAGATGYFFAYLIDHWPFARRVEKVFENALDHVLAPKGAIYLPQEDAEIARQSIIQENSEKGQGTKLSELE